MTAHKDAFRSRALAFLLESSISSPSAICAGAFAVLPSLCPASAFESEEGSFSVVSNANAVFALFAETSSSTGLPRFVTWRIKRL